MTLAFLGALRWGTSGVRRRECSMGRMNRLPREGKRDVNARCLVLTRVVPCRTLRSVTTDVDDEDTIRQVVDRLQEKNPDAPREQLERIAREEFDAIAGRPVRDYLSILTERASKKRIKREGAGS